MTNLKSSNRNGKAASAPTPSSPADRQDEIIRISKPNFGLMEVKVVGTAPYLQCRFPEKAIQKIREKQAAGSQGKSKRELAPRDFQEMYEGSKHVMEDGSCGIPASAFRAACISACRLVGYKMTVAKLSVFILPDGFDRIDGTPLVRIYGKPEQHEMMGRNDNGGVDLRVRSMWREWYAKVKVQFDMNQFSGEDVINLLERVGMQVGIGEGRPDSRNSAGMGLGTFSVEVAHV